VVDMSSEGPRFLVPDTAPVVVHRHGEGSRRRSIAVLIDDCTDLTPEQVDEALAHWRRVIGGWVTKVDAAARLGLSVQRVDQLRREGRLKSRSIGNMVAISRESLIEELNRRELGA